MPGLDLQMFSWKECADAELTRSLTRLLDEDSAVWWSVYGESLYLCSTMDSSLFDVCVEVKQFL